MLTSLPHHQRRRRLGGMMLLGVLLIIFSVYNYWILIAKATATITSASSSSSSTVHQDPQQKQYTKAAFAIDFSIEQFENRTHVRYPHAGYQCRPGEKVRKLKLGQSGVRDWSSSPINERLPFKTRITATGNLNIAIVGDSLAKQAYDVLFDALAIMKNHSLDIYSKVPDGRINAAATAASDEHVVNNTTVVLVYFQSIGMLVPDQENVTWSREDWANIEAAIPHIGRSSSWDPQPQEQQLYSNLDNTAARQRLLPIDVCLFRPPFPWIELDAITEDSLRQSITLLQQLLRCKCILLMTIPYNNNVSNDTMYNRLMETNQLIRTAAATLDNEHSASSVAIDILDYDLLTRNLMLQNAASIGIPINETFTKRLTRSHYHALQSATCREVQPVGLHVCPPNMLSADGMHWCPETVGGYFAAAVACHAKCCCSQTEEKECHEHCRSLHYAN